MKLLHTGVFSRWQQVGTVGGTLFVVFDSLVSSLVPWCRLYVPLWLR